MGLCTEDRNRADEKGGFNKEKVTSLKTCDKGGIVSRFKSFIYQSSVRNDERGRLPSTVNISVSDVSSKQYRTATGSVT